MSFVGSTRTRFEHKEALAVGREIVARSRIPIQSAVFALKQHFGIAVPKGGVGFYGDGNDCTAFAIEELRSVGRPNGVNPAVRGYLPPSRHVGKALHELW